ncbi:MAG: alpha/beta hydrolase, partial [Ardenticatenaceae bacterium]
FGGLIVLSGRLNTPDDLRKRLPESRTQAIFVAHGTADGMIAVQDARDSLEFLTSEGYKPHYKEYHMGHEINQEVLSDLVPWLTSVVQPAK